MKCYLGCDQDGLYQFNNGKLCCSKSPNSCPAKRKRNSETSKGSIPWSKGKKGIHSKEGLENIVKAHKNKIVSKETRDKMRNSCRDMTGKNNPMYEKHHKEESKELMKIRKEEFEPWNKGKIGLQHQSEEEKERNRQYCLNGHSNYMNTFPRPPVKEETKEKHRKYMLNGGAVVALKGVKNPSKPEVMLRNMVKELYPNCEFQYKVFNYSLDVAIPECKITIEFDGYYHFDCKENIEYYSNRQKRIEGEGWKFIRYTIFDKFPNLDILKEDINKILDLINNEVIYEQCS